MRRTLPRTPQRGAAILAAMLIVVLVATLASALLWQQWRSTEVEAADRGRAQAAWVLSGALDWARLILREDKAGVDHLGEPWAVPLAPARLSTFLAANRDDALAAEAAQDAFLAGQIIDLQARLNVVNLVQDGKIDAASLLAFQRLFELLNLPSEELDTLSAQLVQAQDPQASAASLWPQSLDQLRWLGLSPPTIATLRPYVTVLPARTPVNLNTAPAEVIYACVEAFELADAHQLVTTRNQSHLTTLADASKAAGVTGAQFSEGQHSVSSRFFEVRGQLRLEQTTVQEQSLLQRDGLEVKTLSRQRGMAPLTAPLQ